MPNISFNLRNLQSSSSPSSSEYRSAVNAECFRNDQCWSGYCKNGRCANPEKLHDPCRLAVRNCPGSLTCSAFSRTCVTQSFTPSRSTCHSASDCRYNERCLNGRCERSRPIGASCNSVNPDLCAMGSKCTVSKSFSEPTKCYELCSRRIECPEGYQCVRNVINVDAICVPKPPSNNTRQQLTKAQIDELVYGGLMIITAIFILLFLIYGWIRLTNRADDDSRKKKKKKVKLCHDGNGLATITVIPSNCQSPQPVAASQLFVANSYPYNSNVYPDAPPEYSEVITIR